MPVISLSPHKKLYIEGDDLEKHPDLVRAFQRGSGHGLLALDVGSGLVTEQDTFAYWKDFARLYLSLFASTPNLENHELTIAPIHIEPHPDDTSRMLMTVPPMKGAEYVNEECLSSLWLEMEEALRTEIIEYGKDIPSFFSARHSGWSLLGRVCFHLAENKNSKETPFAFLATYAHRASKDGKAQHLPLSRALEEYAGAKQKSILLRLLSPIHKASLESSFIKEYVDSGDIFHPMAWTSKETYQFLKNIPIFEKAGVVVRVPNWWKAKQANRPQVAIRLGEKTPSGIGFDALVDFSMSVMLGQDELNEKEIQDLLNQSDNLVFFKGQWVEVDKDKFNDILSKWKSVARSVKDGGVTFAEGMRWLAGVGEAMSDADTKDVQSLTRIIPGKWLTRTLEHIRSPEAGRLAGKILGANLKAELRHYQRQGVHWLSLLNQMRLGVILADDMGLGKTIQVISLLLLKRHSSNERPKSLLVAPASLLGNWKAELDRFAPSLKYWIAHPSGQGNKKPENMAFDLAITTYGSVARLPWLSEQEWDIIVADEAQAIKNPTAKQTKAIKELRGGHKIALTGTPVENHLTDLWSLFDFVSPGLLGSAKYLETFVKKKNKEGDSPYAHLRQLVRPYILRRLKTDKSVISDLPDKTEMKSYCQLSKAQIALYQKSVESLAKDIVSADGIKRRGIILSYLMRFKQICNHPSQFVKRADFPIHESGKFLRLKEICDIISEKQEKALVFTQFKEMTEPLHDFLRTVFGKNGLVLHGGTQIKKRSEMVAAFQADDGPPFFVLSLKAGGTGLNLTAAAHVIHFDRWWNPAVENQATDRAFRIGQKKNVLVHKFICEGTLEGKIDALIESKQSLSRELLEGDDGVLLTELPNDELLKIVALDINSAVGEP
ncbi:MAG: DEAD/DEAH box helicase [Nitrospinae bacterium]|nr:DEAD/DEAH box helicase [Nitrospinota bacterium]